MPEKVATIEVDLKINDREYADGARKATTETEKLDKKATDLSKSMEEVGRSAKKTGSELKEVGKDAENAAGKFEASIGKMTSFKGVGKVIGGVALGGMAGMAIGSLASSMAELNDAKKIMGLASGGDTMQYAEMKQLFDSLNLKTPNSPDVSARISTFMNREFGYLSDSEKSVLGEKLNLAKESGEDVDLIAKSLNILARQSGAMYRMQGFGAIELLEKLNGAAIASGNNLGSTLASAATMMIGGKGHLSVEDIAQYLVAGFETYGEDAGSTAARVLRGLQDAQEPTTLANKDLRNAYPLVSDQIWETEYHRAWKKPVKSVSIGAGMTPDRTSKLGRNASFIPKYTIGGLGNLLSDLLNDPWGSLQGAMASAPPIDTTTMDQGYFTFGKPQNFTIINQNFSIPPSPSIEGQKAAERESARMARM